MGSFEADSFEMGMPELSAACKFAKWRAGYSSSFVNFTLRSVDMQKKVQKRMQNLHEATPSLRLVQTRIGTCASSQVDDRQKRGDFVQKSQPDTAPNFAAQNVGFPSAPRRSKMAPCLSTFSVSLPLRRSTASSKKPALFPALSRRTTVSASRVRRTQNVPGDFYVDSKCIDCDMCRCT